MGGPHRDAASGAREIRSALAESRRSFLAVGLFSAFVNLPMLTGPVFMLQVYDRVLSSRSEATLVALIGIVAFLFLAMGLLAITWFDYPLKGRSGSRDREQLRAFLGFRQATGDDMEPIQRWLSQEVVPQDQDPRHLRSSVLDWCREHRIEPPSSDRTAISHVQPGGGLMPCWIPPQPGSRQ